MLIIGKLLLKFHNTCKIRFKQSIIVFLLGFNPLIPCFGEQGAIFRIFIHGNISHECHITMFFLNLTASNKIKLVLMRIQGFNCFNTFVIHRELICYFAHNAHSRCKACRSILRSSSILVIIHHAQSMIVCTEFGIGLFKQFLSFLKFHNRILSVKLVIFPGKLSSEGLFLLMIFIKTFFTAKEFICICIKLHMAINETKYTL